MTKPNFPYTNSGPGYLARDRNGGALQTATAFSTQDANVTQVVSPLTYIGATIYTLTIPGDAVQLIIGPTTDLRVSDDPAMTRYDVVTAGAKEAFPVTLMQYVYIQRDTANGTVRFRFAKV